MNTDIEITTMCAVFSGDQVLMINRTKSWKGWAFPGGHVEHGESIIDCVKREMFEETGIIIDNPTFKGIANIFNTVNYKRHIIYNFTCNQYEGIAKEYCDEGNLQWINVLDIEQMPMAEGMEYRIPLFTKDKMQELYIEWNEEQGYTSVEYCEM